jgi:sec-independent protein translocase protein TatA
MPGWIGPWELAILLIVVLLVFGPKRLPEMGKSLGKGMREFKESLSTSHDEKESDELPAAPKAAPSVEQVSAEQVSAASRDRDAV